MKDVICPSLPTKSLSVRRPEEECQDSEVELRRRKNEKKNTTAERLKEVEKADDWKKIFRLGNGKAKLTWR